VDQEGRLPHVGHFDHVDGAVTLEHDPVLAFGTEPDGLTVDQGMSMSARWSLPVICSKAPSLKTLQFW